MGARQLPYPVTARRPLTAARAAACAEFTPGAVAGDPQAAAFDVRSGPVHDLTPAPTLAELNGAIRQDAGPVQAA
jgi:hypothetical protein